MGTASQAIKYMVLRQHPLQGALAPGARDGAGRLLRRAYDWGRGARGVEAERIQFERTSGYRNGPGQVWGVPVWEYARSGGR